MLSGGSSGFSGPLGRSFDWPEGSGVKRPIPQDPTVCLVVMFFRGMVPALGRTSSQRIQRLYHVDVPSMSSHRTTYESEARYGHPEECQVLLRKEVIQPHLPVRLPCYDLVPIANPTLDGSFPYGLGHRLRVLPTFVT